MKARIKTSEGKAALFFIDSDKAENISRVLEDVNIVTVIPPRENYGGKMYSVLKLDGFPEEENIPASEDFPADEFIMFYGMTNSKVGKVLKALRQKNISVRFKAVLTDLTRNLTLREVMEHMFKEEAEINKQDINN